ncbi:Mannose-6-phosphate isomerase [compost metagenome]
MIISGSGECMINSDKYLLKAGNVVNIPVGVKHAIRATTDLELIEVQRGVEILDEDIYRIDHSWQEAIFEKEISENWSGVNVL